VQVFAAVLLLPLLRGGRARQEAEPAPGHAA
jgi:hypothetical protein